MARNKPPVRPISVREVPKSDVRLFLSYFRPHLGVFFADLAFALFVALVDLTFPVLSRYTLNSVLPQFSVNPSCTVRLFIIIIAFSVGLYCARTAAYWFITYFGHLFGVHVETDMRRDIFEHIQKQSFSFFDANRTGNIMSRATTDLFEISELAHHGPEDLLISLLTLTGAFIIMLKIRWELALIVFITLPVMIIGTRLRKKSLMNTSRGVKEKTAVINSSLESAVSGIRVTKVFTNEEYQQKKFSADNGEFFTAKRFYYKAMAGFHSQMEFVTHILNVVVLAAGGFFIMKGKMTIGDLVAANLFVSAFLQPIRRLTNFVEQFSTGMAGFMRFSEIMHTRDEIPEEADARELTEVKGEVTYKGVHFAYKNGIEILKDVSFTAPAGKTIALVGHTGSGKTTICHLLPRFYDVTGGDILLDGNSIRSITLKSLRKQIGIVQQDVFLFAGSVRENIQFGRPDATEEEIIEAAKKAEIWEDIEAMPDGLDTIVGERGIKLSGGQKQRISIARVFLKNPPILILDEATSALDSVTELKIQSAFEKLSQGRTTFIIAHRLSTIRKADQIAVVQDKTIVEQGSHDELMARGGVYHQLFTAQYQQVI